MTNSTQCNQPDCGQGGKLTRGMCAKHYRYWLDHTPADQRGAPPRFRRSFWDYVDKTESCWVWTGPTIKKGYGFWSGLGSDGRQGLAHRISLAAVVPCPDESLFACHHCDNPPCVNPAHLYWGSALDNARDVVERGGVHNLGSRSTACPRGHAIEGANLRVVGRDGLHVCRKCDNERSRKWQAAKRAVAPPSDYVPPSGEAHPMARLTWDAVREIRARHKGGAVALGLAREFGISEAHIWRILANKAWKETLDAAG